MVSIDELPNGVEVFVDANIFIYHYANASPQCTRFLQRLEDGEIVGVCSTHILAEVLHRRMIAEAIEKGIVSAKNAISKLSKKPLLIKRLSEYSKDVEILMPVLDVVPVQNDDVLRSHRFRKRYGMLTNDSIVLAVMQRLELVNLVSRDDAFDLVKDVSVWKPTDI